MVTPPRKRGVEGGSDAQKRGQPSSPPDAVGANKKTSTPSTSDRSTTTKTTNLNLTQGRFLNRLLELVRIFTARLMMTRWRRLCIKFVKADMIERVIHGNRSYIYRDMLASWKRSRNHMKGPTSPVWTLGMFQMVTGHSCQCMKRTKQSTACDITIRHASCTVAGCGQTSEHFQSENSMMRSRKALWTRRWKAHWRQEWIPNCRLVMTKESSPMMKEHTGNGSSLRWVRG